MPLEYNKSKKSFKKNIKTEKIETIKYVLPFSFVKRLTYRELGSL